MNKSKFGVLIIIVLLLSIFSFRLWQTTGCRQFKSFYLNPESIKIRVEEDVNSDIEINRNISRFFHNKAQTAFVLAASSLASTLDARTLLEILGPLGLTAFIWAIFLTVRHRKLMQILHLIAVLVAASISILTVDAKQSFYLYLPILYSFSLWSAKALSKYVLFVLILGAVTFWFFALNWQTSSFCHDIFFN